ncbi:hypothetical protein AF332_17255 [Sporosarcina globispora]|uniref:Replicative helicase inhibitor G39P N-terminal domain-containing protein n=1 Tax=Sporosarcina globispora TaxID=1459 RepID=A0A0M0GEN5_SPOGL|nr:hypothetical protein [Sporosarcina globispora]KON88380.1 hypothetical protein AF332_17255 [Sporosarcina globispora]
MNKTEMLKLLVLIERIYTPFRIKNDLVHYFFDHCQEFDYEMAIRYIKEHIRRSPYPPSLRHIASKCSIHPLTAEMYDSRYWEKEYVLSNHVS